MSLLQMFEGYYSAVIVLSAVFILFCIALVIYYRRFVRPLTPYLYLSPILSVRESDIRSAEMMRKEFPESLKGMKDIIDPYDEYGGYSKHGDYGEHGKHSAYGAHGDRNDNPVRTTGGVDRLIDARFAKAFDEVYAASPAPMRTVLEVFVMPDELLLLKLLFKRAAGISENKKNIPSPTMIRGLQRGSIPERIIDEALEVKTLSGLKDIFRATIYESMVAKAAASESLTDRMTEDFMQGRVREALTISAKPCYKRIRNILKIFIDMLNLERVLSGVGKDSADNESYGKDSDRKDLNEKNLDRKDSDASSYLTGGSIPVQRLKEAASYQHLIDIMRAYGYDDVLEGIDDAKEPVEEYLPRRLQLGMRSRLIHDAHRMSMDAFHHPIRVVGYLLRKQVEQMNFRSLMLSVEMRQVRYFDMMKVV